VPAEAPSAGGSVRGAELIGALCLATDLGMGLPFEHGLHRTQVTMRLADRLGVGPDVASDAYYASLLTYCGCTADAEISAEIFGGALTEHFVPATFGSLREQLTGVVRALPDPAGGWPRRALQVARRLPPAARFNKPHLTASCEVGEMLSDRLGLPASVRELFAHLTERWDGKGPLRRAEGDEIPLALRIVHVAKDATLQRALGGAEHAAAVIRERAGRAFDPAVAGCLVEGAGDILAVDTGPSAWEATLAAEPQPRLVLEGDAIEDALSAMGDFADLVSPYLVGHSAGVATLAGAAAEQCGLEPAEKLAIRRAALVHDLGRVAVAPRIWQKPEPLTADEWEQVRLHPYHTERVLSRPPLLATLAPIASAHHERLDGSGYHRGAHASALGLPARVLAAADAYHSMTEPRPHRAPLTPDMAAEALVGEASAGRLDADAVRAVVEAAGQPAPPITRPAGLTEREAEVVGLLARGLQTKQIARALEISVKTADRHIQNAYSKIGISTRAAATLFAMEHGLAAWGELPIAGAPGRP
jgi:HD-GYP domain-containing protein (c-di-GMP phosphodiesterase class II)